MHRDWECVMDDGDHGPALRGEDLCGPCRNAWYAYLIESNSLPREAFEVDGGDWISHWS